MVTRKYVMVSVATFRTECDRRSFGLGVRMRNGQVVVSSLKNDSIAKDRLRVGDVITAVNDVPVTSLGECKELIQKYQKNLKIQYERYCVGEHAETKENAKEASTVTQSNSTEQLKMRTAEEYNDELEHRWSGLPRDIKTIMKEQYMHIRYEGVPQARKPSKNGKTEPNRINISEEVDVQEIGTDVPKNKTLKPPPKS